MLTATGIYKRYGRRKILKGVDLAVAPGTCVGIIGSNGCGKTTLLSILAGTLKADRGQIGNMETSRNAVAYVPQENPLFFIPPDN